MSSLWKFACLLVLLLVFAFAPGMAVDRSAVLSQAAGVINSVAEKALPAVVSIATIRQIDTSEEALGVFGPGITPFDLFGAPQKEAAHVPKFAANLGSGVVIDASGLILTNHHVVEAAERITIFFDEHHKAAGVLVGSDPKTDLALIKLKDSSLLPKIVPLKFGDSTRVKVGDWAIAVGSPFGLKRSVTTGIVSATGRGRMGALDTEDFIQTDAAINPGSSGGPLLDSSGEIIGVNTAIFSQSGGFIGIGFAIPSNLAQEIALQLKNNGRVIRGYLGLTAQDLDPQLAKFFKTSGVQGALITEVEPQGPAGKAKLIPGDVIRTYNHVQVQSADHLKGLVAKSNRGADVEVELVRDGEPVKQAIGITEAPGAPKKAAQLAGQAPSLQLGNPADPNQGLTVREVLPELATYLSLPPKTGVLVVGVVPGSAAFDSGVLPGDVVLKAGVDKVHSPQEFQRALKKDKSPILYIQRGNLGIIGHGNERLFVALHEQG